MPADYSGPQLITVKGWVSRSLVLYVNGTQPDGPLAPYLFFLIFEDEAGRKMYSLPMEYEGTPIKPRLMKPDLNGVIRVGPTPVHPRRGSLMIKAWPADARRGLPDLQARCSFMGNGSGPLLFRVDYAVDMGQDSTQDARGRTMGSPTITESSGTEYSMESTLEAGVEANLGIIKVGDKANAKMGYKKARGHSMTSEQDTWTTGTTTTSVRPVAYMRSISIKSVTFPPDM